MPILLYIHSETSTFEYRNKRENKTHKACERQFGKPYS